MKLFVVLILIFTGVYAFGQSIYFGYGPIYTHTAQKVRMINSNDDFQHTDNQFLVGYEHFFRSKNFSLLAQYSRYEGNTWMKFREGEYLGSDGFWTLGSGFSGIDNDRIDICVAYNFINEIRNFFLKSNIGIGFQRSKDNGWDFYSTIEKINGPVYFETKSPYVVKYPQTQVVPTLGIKAGFWVFKRIELSLSFQGIYAFRSFLDMYFEYTYYDEPQETAIFQGKGTGLYISLNIGYRFVKPKK